MYLSLSLGSAPTYSQSEVGPDWNWSLELHVGLPCDPTPQPLLPAVSQDMHCITNLLFSGACEQREKMFMVFKEWIKSINLWACSSGQEQISESGKLKTQIPKPSLPPPLPAAFRYQPSCIHQLLDKNITHSHLHFSTVRQQQATISFARNFDFSF